MPVISDRHETRPLKEEECRAFPAFGSFLTGSEDIENGEGSLELPSRRL